MQTQKFVRKPFIVDAIQVTPDNMDEVATWCSGKVRNETTPDGDLIPYVKVDVHKPAFEKQTRAYVSCWVLDTGKGFKVYTEKGFENSFDPQYGIDRDEATQAEKIQPHPGIFGAGGAGGVHVAHVTPGYGDLPQ